MVGGASYLKAAWTPSANPDQEDIMTLKQAMSDDALDSILDDITDPGLFMDDGLYDFGDDDLDIGYYEDEEDADDDI